MANAKTKLREGPRVGGFAIGNRENSQCQSAKARERMARQAGGLNCGKLERRQAWIAGHTHSYAHTHTHALRKLQYHEERSHPGVSRNENCTHMQQIHKFERSISSCSNIEFDVLVRYIILYKFCACLHYPGESKMIRFRFGMSHTRRLNALNRQIILSPYARDRPTTTIREDRDANETARWERGQTIFIFSTISIPATVFR